MSFFVWSLLVACMPPTSIEATVKDGLSWPEAFVLVSQSVAAMVATAGAVIVLGMMLGVRPPWANR